MRQKNKKLKLTKDSLLELAVAGTAGASPTSSPVGLCPTDTITSWNIVCSQ